MTKMNKRILSIALSVLLLLTAFTGFALASAITIVEQPEAVKGYKGETATFSVEAEGEDLEYQWQMRLKKGEEYKDIKGANEESYTTPALLNSHSHRRFQVVITDGDGHKVVSESANLIVRPASIRITEDPSPQKIEEGETATYSVKAEGPGSLSYQWQKRLPGEKEYLNIDDANEASYTTGEVSLADKHSRFRCVVTNDKGMESISGSANLMVLEKKEEPTEAPSEEPSEGPDAPSSSAPSVTSTPEATATATAAPTATATATAAPTAAPGGGGGGGGGDNTSPTQPPNVPVTSVNIALETLALAIRGSSTLTANVLPANASNTAVTWSTADATIASVSATGLVIGVAPGTTIITATSQADSSIFGRCAVTVENVEKLATPTNLQIDSDGVLSWDAVDGAQGYRIKAYNTDTGGTYFWQTNAVLGQNRGSFTLTGYRHPTVGNLVFTVQARGSTMIGVTTAIDSDESEKSSQSIVVQLNTNTPVIENAYRDGDQVVIQSAGFVQGDSWTVGFYHNDTAIGWMGDRRVETNGQLSTAADGRWAIVNGVSLTKDTWTASGNGSIAGTYTRYSESPVYTISALTITNIAVTTQPTKLAYVEGERLDLSGMVVTITYDDTSTTTVTCDQPYSLTEYNITSTPLHDAELTLANDGISVTVIYQLDRTITATTLPITVTARDSSATPSIP